MMNYRNAGRSDLKLSILGAGCWAYGGGAYWGEQSQRDVDAVVGRALDLGINYFDTAEAYNDGASERSLGLALKGRRDSVVIGTKVSPNHCYRRTLPEHCEASLQRLGVETLDLYMIHWPIHPHSIRHFTGDTAVIESPPTVEEAFESLIRLRDQGKIRHIGVSNFGPARMREALALCPDLVVNELPYSLLTRAIECDMLPACRRAGVGVIGYMTLLQGLLADIYPTLADVPPWQRRSRHFSSKSCELTRHGEDGAEAETNAAIAAIREIMVHSGLSMPALAVKWALARPEITCALVGARNAQELEENAAFVREPLDPAWVEALNNATRPLLEKLGPGFDYYEAVKNDRTL